MKKYFLVLMVLFFTNVSFAQKTLVYNPGADAKLDIENAVKKAKSEGKYVLLQAGGNWCKWCIEFHRMCTADKQLDSMINANFVWYHLNYSKENKNLDIFEKYRYPQRFGFPVFLILDENGSLIHTQNSEYLEDGKSSYDKNKVLSFLGSWSPAVFDKEKYK